MDEFYGVLFSDFFWASGQRVWALKRTKPLILTTITMEHGSEQTQRAG